MIIRLEFGGTLGNDLQNKLIMPYISLTVLFASGGELLELRLLDTQLLGSKSIARHKFYQLLESS